MIVCAAAGNPYADGISYFRNDTGPFSLTFESGVAVNQSASYNGVYVSVYNGTAPGDVTIDTRAGSITTSQDFTSGITASAFGGPLTVRSGDITTSGGWAYGISAYNDTNLVVDATAGSVVTTGEGAIGIWANSVAPLASVTAGAVTTTGMNASALSASLSNTGGSMSIDSRAGLLQTSGAGSSGIGVFNTDGNMTIDAGAIQTSGAASFGIGLLAEGRGLPGGPVDTTNVITVHSQVVASGANSGGVVARGSGDGSDAITITTNANVTATGQNSPGISASSLHGPVRVNVAQGVTVMGGWSANPADLSSGDSVNGAGQSSVGNGRLGIGLPAAGVVLFSGSTAGAPAAHLINNGVIGAMNDRAVTMGFPCGGANSVGDLFLFNMTPTAPGKKSWLGTFASVISNALVPSAHAAVPPANRGCDPGDPSIGRPADSALNLPAVQSVTIDNHGTITGYVTLWDGAAHTFNNLSMNSFEIRHFADTDGDGVRDTKAVSISDFGGPNSTFNNPGMVRFAPVANAARTDYYVPTTGIDNRPLEASFYDLNREGVVQGQFVNLQTFNHSGVIDLRGPEIGNTLVMTSNPAAGGAPGTGTFVANGGQLLVNTRLNEGIAPGGASGSYSDMLIVDRTLLGSGATSIGIGYDPASAGALTTGNGIELVEVRDKANSAAGVFVQGNRVAGGAYEYTLHHNGIGADATDGNWYLRSTRIVETPVTPVDPVIPGTPPIDPPAPVIELPDYRPEVPVDMVVPAMASRLGLTMLGTYDDRMGAIYADPPAEPAQPQDIWCKDASRNFRCTPTVQQNAYYAGSRISDPYRWRMWGRFFGEYGNYRAGGTGDSGRLANFESRGPSYDFRLGGMQLGADLYRDPFNTAGFYFGYGRAMADVDAVFGGPAGKVSMDGYSLGGYWTHRRPSGWYFDTIAQGTYYGSIDARSVLGERLKTDGWGFAGSLETGYPIALGASWTLTPQAQVVYQHLDIAGGADSFGRISYGASDSVYGRLGAKLNKDWATGDGRIVSTWARVNYWHSFGAQAKTTFTSLDGSNPVTLGTQLGDDWMQFGLGASGQLSRDVNVFASADYNLAVAQGNGHSVGGRVGMQVRW